jgi:hypothetical protein
MRQFVVKVLALENSLYVAKSTANVTPDVIGYTVANTALNAAFDATSRATWSAIGNIAVNAVENLANNVTKGATGGRMVKNIDDIVCSSVMNDYNKIFTAIDNLGSAIQPKEGMNPINVTRRLIKFDDMELERLSLMNRRFRFFYFLKVHEIISSTPLGDDNSNVEKDLLLNEFNHLLKKLGDLDEYNQLFESDITVDRLEESTTIHGNNFLGKNNFPRDLTKLIVNYCQLSIEIADDLNLIFNKIILF